MDVKATAKTVRVTPRKARRVLDLIRGNRVIFVYNRNHSHTKQLLKRVFRICHTDGI